MTKTEKTAVIEELTQVLNDNDVIYLTDISELNAEQTSNLRRGCFKEGIELKVVKNTLLKKAMESSDKTFDDLYETLKGNTSLMISDTGNSPAKLIKKYRKTSEKPILKGAYVEESMYVGDDQIEALTSIKSKDELIADVIAILQSPIKNVVGSLQSGGSKLSGIIKTLSEKE